MSYQCSCGMCPPLDYEHDECGPVCGPNSPCAWCRERSPCCAGCGVVARDKLARMASGGVLCKGCALNVLEELRVRRFFREAALYYFS